MNLYNDGSRKISKPQKILIIISFIIIIIWGIYFVIHVIDTIENNNPVSNSLIYLSSSSSIMYIGIWQMCPSN
jgi:NO-binding membrane sensor protein with MHYT domain